MVAVVFPGLCTTTFSPFIFITLVDAFAFSLSGMSIRDGNEKIRDLMIQSKKMKYLMEGNILHIITQIIHYI